MPITDEQRAQSRLEDAQLDQQTQASLAALDATRARATPVSPPPERSAEDMAPVLVSSPEGKVGTVPAWVFKGAEAAGHKGWSLATPEQQKAYRSVRDEGILSDVSRGISTVLPQGLRSSDPEELARQQAFEKLHPTVTGIGSTVRDLGVVAGSAIAPPLALGAVALESPEQRIGNAVFAARTLDSFAFGVPGIIAKGLMTKEQNAAWEKAVAEHSIEGLGGDAIGMVTSLGSPIFKLATKAGRVGYDAVLGTKTALEAASHVAPEATEGVAKAIDDAVVNVVKKAPDVATDAALAGTEHLTAPRMAEEAMPKAIDRVFEEKPYVHPQDELQKAIDSGYVPEHGPWSKVIPEAGPTAEQRQAVIDGVHAGQQSFTEQLADHLSAKGVNAEDAAAVAKELQTTPTQRMLPNVVASVERAMGPGVPRRLLAKAVQLSVEGAILQAPAAVAHAAMGDHEQAAESLVWGAGLNLVLGGTLSSLGKAVEKSQEALGEGMRAASSGLGDFATNNSLRVMGIDGTRLPDVAKQDIARVGQQHDLIGPHAQVGWERLAKEASSRVDSTLQEADSIAKGVMYKFETEPLINKISDQLIEPHRYPNGSLNTFWSKETSRAQETINNIRQLGPNPSLTKLNSIYEALIAHGGTVEGSTEQKAATLVKDHIANDIDQFSKQVTSGEGPSVADRYAAESKERTTAQLALDNSMGKPASGPGTVGAEALIGGGVMAAGHVASGGATAILGYAARRVGRSLWASEGQFMAAKYLNKLAQSGDPAVFGMQIARQAALQGQSLVDQVGPFLKRGLQRADTVAAESLSSKDPIKHALGDEATGLSKAQQLDRLRTNLAQASSNPDAFSGPVGHVAGLVQPSLPNVAQGYALKQASVIAYLQAAIPKASPPDGTFGAVVAPKTDHAELKAFTDKLEVVIDPFSVYHHLANDTLTRDHMDALTKNFPKTYSNMVQEVNQLSFDPKAPKLNSTQRNTLSLFLGRPLDPTLQYAAMLQQGYTQASEQAPQGGPAKGSKGSSKIKGSGRSTQTETERVSMGMHSSAR